MEAKANYDVPTETIIPMSTTPTKFGYGATEELGYDLTILDDDSADFVLHIDVPEGLLGQVYEGELTLWLDGEEMDVMDVMVTLERGDAIAVYPNPYRMAEHEGGITIAIGDVSGDLGVMVYDMYGTLVAELSGEAASRGTDIQWDLKNDDGKTVASGMYLVTIDTGDEVVTRKIMVIK